MVKLLKQSNTCSTMKSEYSLLSLIINCATCTVEELLRGFQGQGIYWSSFKRIRSMQHPQNANFLLIFAIFYYFTPFTHSTGPSYLIRGFVFVLFIFRHILVPSSGPSSTHKPPQMQIFSLFSLFFTILALLTTSQDPHTLPDGLILCYLYLSI